jgi:hypothetical protein
VPRRAPLPVLQPAPNLDEVSATSIAQIAVMADPPKNIFKKFGDRLSSNVNTPKQNRSSRSRSPSPAPPPPPPQPPPGDGSTFRAPSALSLRSTPTSLTVSHSAHVAFEPPGAC